MNNDILAHIQEHLINKIQSTTDAKELVQIWMLWDNLQRPVQLTPPHFRRIPKDVTVESLKKAQNFKKMDWAKANAWAKSLDIQESAEDLIKQLTK
jgi:hypothetical protein